MQTESVIAMQRNFRRHYGGERTAAKPIRNFLNISVKNTIVSIVCENLLAFK